MHHERQTATHSHRHAGDRRGGCCGGLQQCRRRRPATAAREAFVWATALINDPGSSTAVPRFMTLATPAELLATDENAGEPKPRPLAARSETFQGSTGFTEGAGAIVEADGNMLVAPNGYPVYASVHMNKSYFDTAKKNLIATGGYQSQPAESSFGVGAAVFKATWLRLDADQKAPAGSYTTQPRSRCWRPGLHPASSPSCPCLENSSR